MVLAPISRVMKGAIQSLSPMRAFLIERVYRGSVALVPCKHGPGVASGAISSGFYRTTRTCDRLDLVWESARWGGTAG